jgi:hypothetical protein
MRVHRSPVDDKQTGRLTFRMNRGIPLIKRKEYAFYNTPCSILITGSARMPDEIRSLCRKHAAPFLRHGLPLLRK